MNKRGEEAGHFIMFFVFLFFVIAIGVGLVIGTVMFFGNEYDFREVDSKILGTKVSECIVEKSISWENEKDFFDKCDIDLDSLLNNHFVLKICRNSENCILEDSNDKILVQIGSNFQACQFEGVKENSAFPKCYTDSFSHNELDYTVISGSNQKATSRRIVT